MLAGLAGYTYTSYTLYNEFRGEDCTLWVASTGLARQHAERSFGSGSMRENTATGVVTIHFHSNHWIKATPAVAAI